MVALPLNLPVINHGQEKTKEMDNTTNIQGAHRSFFELACFIAWSPIHLFFKICRSKIALLLIIIPWKIIVYIFKLRGGKNALNDIMSLARNAVEEAENVIHGKDESPLAEEIAISNVTELSKMGVKFSPTKGGLSIQFDKFNGVFHLPVIHLNDNSDVVLRNLVAYKTCMGPEAMVFTRYMKLINGIIDTKEDVRILREAGILLNHLKNDEEAASLWNGMTKSVKVTKVAVLNKAIEGANAYYSASWKV